MTTDLTSSFVGNSESPFYPDAGLWFRDFALRNAADRHSEGNSRASAHEARTTEARAAVTAQVDSLPDALDITPVGSVTATLFNRADESGAVTGYPD
jgi:hypothetical protein